jgi:hypothetical protein
MSSKSFITKYQDTVVEEPYLADLLSTLASGTRPFQTNLKDPRTAAGKILRKLPVKPHYSEQEIADFLRGNIIAHDQDDAQAVLQQLHTAATVISVDNYVQAPTTWGYDGININIQTPGGNKAEVQIHTPETLAVQKALHPLYEEWRNATEIPLEVFAEAQRLADEARNQVRLDNSVK